MEIESIELQTFEDLLSGDFCECGHLVNEHYNGEISHLSKCFALIFNGTVWSSCKCTKLKQKVFEIRVMVEDYAENTSKAA